MKKKVHKLKGFVNNHFKLLAISSHENDYRLSWAINEELGSHFRKVDSIFISSKEKSPELEFTVFKSSADEDFIDKMNLISNRCSDGFLIREMKNIDFFIQIFRGDMDNQTKHIIATLKKIEIISAVFEVPSETMKISWNLPPE